MRKRLRYLKPSLAQSLIVKPVIPRVFRPQSRKTGMESRIKPPQPGRKQLMTCYTT